MKWSRASEKARDTGVLLEVALPGTPKQVTWHRRGDYFATLSPEAGNRAVLIHQLSKHQTQAPFKRTKGAVQRIAFHPTKPHFFVATQRYVRVYDLLAQSLIKTLQPGLKWISSLDVHPMGDNVIVGSYDKRLVWHDMDLSDRPYKILKYVSRFCKPSSELTIRRRQVPRQGHPFCCVLDPLSPLPFDLRRWLYPRVPRDGLLGPDDEPAPGTAKGPPRAPGDGQLGRLGGQVASKGALDCQRRRGRGRQALVSVAAAFVVWSALHPSHSRIEHPADSSLHSWDRLTLQTLAAVGRRRHSVRLSLPRLDPRGSTSRRRPRNDTRTKAYKSTVTACWCGSCRRKGVSSGSKVVLHHLPGLPRASCVLVPLSQAQALFFFGRGPRFAEFVDQVPKEWQALPARDFGHSHVRVLLWRLKRIGVTTQQFEGGVGRSA